MNESKPESLTRRDHSEQTHEEAIQACARVLIRSVVDIIEADSHQFTPRPCATCRAVTAIIGQPFGCYRKQSVIGPGTKVPQ